MSQRILLATSVYYPLVTESRLDLWRILCEASNRLFWRASWLRTHSLPGLDAQARQGAKPLCWHLVLELRHHWQARVVLMSRSCLIAWEGVLVLDDFCHREPGLRLGRILSLGFIDSRCRLYLARKWNWLSQGLITWTSCVFILLCTLIFRQCSILRKLYDLGYGALQLPWYVYRANMLIYDCSTHGGDWEGI